MRNYYKAIFFIILLLAFLTRFWNLDALSLRLDETQSVWQASHSLEFIRQYMLKNVHMPLHNSLLNMWIRLFGTSPVALRTISAIPGFLCVPALFLLSSEIIGRRKSVLTMFLAAISPFWIWYSREIRMYTLLTLITILSYYFFIRAIKENRSIFYILYIVINTIGIHTHYFFLLVLLVQAIYYTVFELLASQKLHSDKVKQRLHQLVYFGLCGLTILALFAPWLIDLYKSYGSGTYAPVLAKPTTFNIILSYFEFTNGFLPDRQTAVFISFWPLLILFIFMFLSKRHNPFYPGMALATMGALAPIFITFFASISITPLYLTRYLIIASPMYYILIAWYFSEIIGFKKYVLTGLFIVFILASLAIQIYHPDNPANENYREAVKFISENATARDIVMLSPPYTTYPFEYYYTGIAKSTSIPIWNKRKGGIPKITTDLIEQDAEKMREYHEKMYLLLTMNLNDAAEVKKYFDNHYTKLDKRRFSKDIWVEVYQASYK